LTTVRIEIFLYTSLRVMGHIRVLDFGQVRAGGLAEVPNDLQLSGIELGLNAAA
jgi:hypothetical protein